MSRLRALWFTGAILAAAGLWAGAQGHLSAEQGVSGREGPPSIILISLDTLRADRLGAYGSELGLTPNLDRFASQSVVFESAHAQASETLFSHASLMTSRYPSELGHLDYLFRVDGDPPTLAQVLSNYDYQTAGVVSGGHLGPTFGMNTGFDSYQVAREWGGLVHAMPKALDWLDGRDTTQPFFLFLHSYDVHDRYLKPSPFGLSEVAGMGFPQTAVAAVKTNNGVPLVLDSLYWEGRTLPDVLDMTQVRPWSPQARSQLATVEANPEMGIHSVTPDDRAFIEGTYHGAVRYTDALFGVWMAELESRGVLDESIIVVVADHGEELGEGGLFNHRLTLSDAVTHVPLMIRMPGGEGAGTRVSGQVGLIDVMPTLLEAAGALSPAGVQGHSLLASVEGGVVPTREVVFSESPLRRISARSARGRLVFSGIGADSPWLMDTLAVSHLGGPAFEVEGSLTESDRELLRDELVAWRRGLTLGEGGGAALTEEQIRVLQDGGYWGPQ
jgi:arylsulfatase A-like enzyme